MRDANRFETPENVRVDYETAGLGTRYLAWFVDQVILWLLMIVVFVGLIIAGASFESLFDSVDGEDFQGAIFYFVGLMALVWGLSSFLYFGLSELLLRGQTIGKRMLAIRVVKADGFQLDASSILIRSLFRVLDHLPPMWIVPVLSQRAQRAGDMVAGTIVVADAPAQLSDVRIALDQRPASEVQFRFDHTMLKRLSTRDFSAVEQILDRWQSLPENQKDELLRTFADQIARKLKIDPPASNERVRFLEDLFAAELRRQDRALV